MITKLVRLVDSNKGFTIAFSYCFGNVMGSDAIFVLSLRSAHTIYALFGFKYNNPVLKQRFHTGLFIVYARLESFF